MANKIWIYLNVAVVSSFMSLHTLGSINSTNLIAANDINQTNSAYAGAMNILSQDIFNQEITNTTNDITVVAAKEGVEENELVDETEDLNKEKESECVDSDMYDTLSNNVPWHQDGCHSRTYTYMSYKKITSKNTVQYAINNDPNVYTDENGIRRVPCVWDNEDYYLVAIGTGYGFSAGDYIAICFKDGTVVKAIVGDIKSDNDTDPTNKYHAIDGSVVEFIVDNTKLDNPDSFEGHGPIISIEALVMG